MARTKIDYGIDLGTTNSAISRMENGEPIIKKNRHFKRYIAFMCLHQQEKSISSW